MFKKDPQPKALANIKSSDRKKLLGSICELYDIPKDKLTKDQEHQLLPSIIKQSTFKSIQNYQGTIYYNENETPIYFKSRDSDIYPSVFSTWQNGYLLPLVITHAGVIDHLKNGADLMLPGCGLPFDKRIHVGTTVGIIDYKKPGVVQAIGVANLDLGKLDKLGQGIAVKVHHYIGDELYKLNKLVEIDEPKEVDTKEPWEEEQQQQEPQEQHDQQDDEEQEKLKAEPIEPNSDKEESDINDLAETVSELTIEEIDNFFIRSLLQSIKLDTIPLPISSSNFMSNHVLKNLPIIDSKYKNIKKTSFKKTGKFLKSMVKLGYIQVKGKDDDITIISTISKLDPKIIEFNTHKIGKVAKQDSNGGNKGELNMLKVVQLYQPTNKYRMFINKLDQEYNMSYTLSEIKTLISTYIKKFNLVDTKKPTIIIPDNELKEIIGVDKIGRNEILNIFIKRMTLKYTILKLEQSINDDNIVINNGEIPKILITCETKIGRKTITRVKNFEKFFIKPHIIEEDLRNLCQGSSTLIKENNDYEVVVQGPHYKIINEYLIGKGVPGGFINFEDKSKKKRR